MVGRSVKKLVKGVATRLVKMAMCISTDIPKCSLRKILKPDYFSKYLHRNWTGFSEQSCEGAIEIDSEERVVPLDHFTLVGFLLKAII